MREIKFRAWDKDINQFMPKEMVAELSLRFFNDHREYELMQFTGLKDKNGKEIWEGDIVKFMYEGCGWNTCEVSWDKNKNGFHIPPLERLIDGYEVIGNIYENPESRTPNDR